MAEKLEPSVALIIQTMFGEGKAECWLYGIPGNDGKALEELAAELRQYHAPAGLHVVSVFGSSMQRFGDEYTGTTRATSQLHHLVVTTAQRDRYREAAGTLGGDVGRTSVHFFHEYLPRETEKDTPRTRKTVAQTSLGREEADNGLPLEM